ncbi:MAG: CoA pyrophosphatase [Saprospiraceae bacterium]|nr:CoA pyrophosphatase [Bacteroidia bacterium]NNE16767.1 CoA pyrophosphatase [Saprospiraceae bacterium]NNL92318.1 CoA pyrophosphatase [Saprospiraceae bacterium]
MYNTTINSLSKKLSADLPGWQAQKRMSPLKTEKYRQPTKDAMHAAVMVLLYPDHNHDLNTIYIKRTSHNINDKHSGQISFPGGKAEDGDSDLIATALRETHEEIGVNPANINILGELSPLFVYASNFYVQPVIGFINEKPSFKLQVSEVDYIIETRLNTLKNKSAVQFKDHLVRGLKFESMPYYNLNGEVLWGATAMITAEFLSIL